MDEMTGDWLFSCPTINFAQQYAESGNTVYAYQFNHRASTSPWPSWTGAMNGDEIPFVFGQPLNTSYEYNEDEVAFSRKMMLNWANFAKTG